MNVASKFFYIVTTLFLFVAYSWWADAMGGWGVLVQLLGYMVIGAVIVGACMMSFIAVIYYLAIFRSNRYAKRLREAGYAVYLDKHAVQGFALITFIALAFTPIAIYLTQHFWGMHICIQAKECTAREGWYANAIIISSMMWLIALLGFYGMISMWLQSFRPLRHHYNNMKRGGTPNLPRLR